MVASWAILGSVNAEEEIRRRINAQGSITFAEFMELALYWPRGGYYLGAEPIGPSGDYCGGPSRHNASNR